MTGQIVEAARALPETMAGTCRLYLVRHGTTTMNVENRYRGRRDIPLDARGYQDAVDAAHRLSGERLAAVYTGARVPDIRILHGLNNVDYGAWEGMTSEEAEMFDPAAFALYRTSPTQAACPVGERLSDAQQRMLAALQLVGSRHAGAAVAAVTHAVMIRLTLVALGCVDDENWRVSVGRGSVAAFDVENGTIRLASMPAGGEPDELRSGLEGSKA